MDRATLTGTPERDVLRGTPHADVIDAAEGDDVVWGLGGRDVVCGGSGNDLIYGRSGNDTLVGDLGRDLLIGGSGADRVHGGPGADVCDGPGGGCEARERQPRAPILATFYYPWFPEAWDQGGIDPYTRFHPTLGRYDLDRARTRRAHVEAMRRSGMHAAIASWWGAGTSTDRRIRPMLRASRGTRLRWSVYHEGEGQGDPTPAEIADDLRHIGDRYGTDRNFLRIGGRFVVFVYAQSSDGCEMADRWNGARRLGAFVVLKVFSGFESCASQPDAWHQYAPAVAADAQPPHSYSISPGFWKADEATPRLGRSLDRWRADVRRMMRADVMFRLVTTFNEWGEGTAVESAREWRSGSRLGRYLDALRGAIRARAPRPRSSCDIEGSRRDDVLKGSSGSDRICGKGGNDIILGRGGADQLFGGSGSDRLEGGPGRDRLDGGTGIDAAFGGPARDLVSGGSDNDHLEGGSGRDGVRGGPGDDRCPGSGEDASSSCDQSPGHPVIVGAGDIACEPGAQLDQDSCRMTGTARLVSSADPWSVLLLGDNQYESGTLEEHQQVFSPTWGRLKAVTLPTPGNHEYLTPGADGYFDYFGPLAGSRDRGYYSTNIGRWHVVALNSTCSAVGGCDPGDPQYEWLQRDLARDERACTLAFWHHPRFSAGEYDGDEDYVPIWQLLYDDGAEVVLNGHDHNYQHYRPQDPWGRADPSGIRQFVVGSGGKSLYSLQPDPANRVAATDSSFGVLQLTLRPKGYDWRFLALGGGFDDAGTAACR